MDVLDSLKRRVLSTTKLYYIHTYI